MKLRPVRYQMKSDEEDTYSILVLLLKKSRRLYQRVYLVVERWKIPATDPLTLSYNGITAALTKAVQQLKMMFDEIEGKVDQVIDRVDQVFKQLTDHAEDLDKETKMLKEAARQQDKEIKMLKKASHQQDKRN